MMEVPSHVNMKACSRRYSMQKVGLNARTHNIYTHRDTQWATNTRTIPDIDPSDPLRALQSSRYRDRCSY